MPGLTVLHGETGQTLDEMAIEIGQRADELCDQS
jgi:hypothetical protein